MLLQNLFPALPLPWDVIVFNVLGGLGTVLLAYGVFLEPEKRQDAVFLIASACLFIYARFIENTLFSIAMAGLFIASMIEMIEIIIGIHSHTPEDVERYKNLK